MRENLTGNNYGRLTVIELDEARSNRRSFWVCKCQCGNIVSVRSDILKSGATLSCGCLKKEQDRINLTKNHSHKKSGTRIYQIWQGIKSRCFNKNNSSYKRYGGKGIAVCDEWLDFNNFYRWASENGYRDDLTIERKDVSGNYCPENCQWIKPEEQANNRRTNIILNYNGFVGNITQIAKELGLDPKVIYARYCRGDEIERLFRAIGKDRASLKGEANPKTKITKEIAKKIKVRLANGETMTKIAKDLGVSKYIVYDIKRQRTWVWV